MAAVAFEQHLHFVFLFQFPFPVIERCRTGSNVAQAASFSPKTRAARSCAVASSGAVQSMTTASQSDIFGPLIQIIRGHYTLKESWLEGEFIANGDVRKPGPQPR